MKNHEIAEILNRMADILEFRDEEPFKVRAYRNGARAIEDLSRDVADVAAAGEIRKIPGIGEGIEKKVKEFLATGKVSKYEVMRKGIPDGLFELLLVPTLGPRTVAQLHEELGVDGVASLEQAVMEGKLEGLRGFGEKKIENISKGLQFRQAASARKPLGDVLPVARELIELLRKKAGIEKVEEGGSLRRRMETVGDIDILAASDEGERVVRAFASLPPVKRVLAEGPTKASVIVEGGHQADLRVVPDECYGAALQYFTGSKLHNVRLRTIAKERGLKINEYGVFKGRRKIAGRTEEEVYRALKLEWIPPELREDRGEIEAAATGKLPRLVEAEDVRGDLHVHSDHSDGDESIEAWGRIMRGRGYSFVAVTDHLRSARIANGLSIERLDKKRKEIARINAGSRDFLVLHGAEVDILADGTLDYPDEALAKLDIVIASVHGNMNMSETEMTDRVCRALSNSCVDVLAHPTCRLLGERPAVKLDLDKVFEAAARNRTALEINGYRTRMDLGGLQARRAKEMGAMISLGSDSHAAAHAAMISHAISTARRAWLEKAQVLNCMSATELRKWLARRRARAAGTSARS